LSLLAIVGAGLFAISWRVWEAGKPSVPSSGAEDTGKRLGIPYSDLGWKYQVLGNTGRPLGELVTLQGQIVEGPSKGYEDGPTISVQRINGIATQEEVLIRLQPFQFKQEVFQNLKIGKVYELRGYEYGRFQGDPDDAFKEIGSPPAQTTAPYFGVDFVVLKAREILAIKPGK
jgi:hypothetical protein